MKLYVITGACGAGKSTMKDHVSKRLSNERYMAVDIDEVGLNWWDYAGSENESKYHEDALRRAVKMAEGKDLIFVSCMNPMDYFQNIDVPEEIEATHFIALCPSDAILARRLKARPADRGFTSDETIKPQIDYNRWFFRNRSKFQLFIDNTEKTEAETAEIIASYILKATA